MNNTEGDDAVLVGMVGTEVIVSTKTPSALLEVLIPKFAMRFTSVKRLISGAKLSSTISGPTSSSNIIAAVRIANIKKARVAQLPNKHLQQVSSD